MTTTWPEVALGEVCKIVSGATPKTEVAEYWDGGVPWAAPRDLSALTGQQIAETSRTLSQAGLDSCSANLLPINSVLMSSRASIGLVAINTVPMATNQGFKSFIPKEGVLEAKYLYWWIVANRPRIELLGRGATFKEISTTVTAAIKIPLPPLDEQRRIAAILDKADEVRTKRKAALETLETLSQAIFIEMFGDPVTNPMGWEEISFSEACPSHLGKMLDQKLQTGLSPKKYLRNANVRWLRFDLADVAEMDFSVSEEAKYRLNPGDVMICEGGEPGRAAVWRGEIEECYFQKALHRARPRPELADPDFIVHLLWLLANGGGLSDHVTSATIAHLTGEKLKRMVVPMPPIRHQQKFADQIGACERQEKRSKSALQDLDNLFSSLQQRAFQGAL